MSLELCTHSGCGRETNRSASKDGKCVFHCEKRSWFLELDGKQDWSKSKDKVKAFWTAFREEWVDKKTSDFSHFVFPEFTTDADFIRNSSLRKLNEEEAKLSLSFHLSHFLGRVVFSFTTFTQNINFYSATFTRGAIFTAANFTQNADFRWAKFTQNADFMRATFTRDAHFKKAVFTQEINFSQTTFTQNAIFRTTTFTQDASFSGAIFEHRHNFRYASFKQKAFFNGVSYLRRGTFRDCTFEGDAYFTDIATSSHLLFRDVTVHGRFTVGSLGQKPVALKSLAFVGCTFEKDANIHIGNIVTDKLALIRFRNLSSLVKLVSVTVQKHFFLHDSTFSGAELSNIHLPCKKVKIALSSFTKTAFNNVQWGNVERIKADRDTFRQLKAANEDQKNYLQANEFYMMEMKAYREELKDKKWWRQERIDFWFGDTVSDFSNDWVRPILLFLLLSFVFHLVAFTCLHWCEISDFRQSFLGHLLLPIEAWGFYLLHLPLNDFAHFINPLAREAGERYESVYLWWLLHKILSGLVIYQIIVSLRRKTRR